jgi:hypothetical protein
MESLDRRVIWCKIPPDITVHPSKASVTEQKSNGKEARKSLEQQRSRNHIASEMSIIEEAASSKSGPGSV